MSVMMSALEATGQGPFIGVLSKLGDKFGFITCDVVRRHFKRDTFVFKALLPVGVQTGCRLSFTLCLSPSGEPQAENIELLPTQPNVVVPSMNNSNPLSVPQNGNFQQQMQQTQPHMQQMQQTIRVEQPFVNTQTINPLVSQPRQQQQLEFRHTNSGGHVHDNNPLVQQTGNVVKQPAAERMTIYKGKVKNLNLEKGHAFVDCAAVNKKYHRDVYLDKNELELGPLEIGMEVYFVLKNNPGNMNQPRGQIVPAHGAFEGVLTEFNQEKGYGFVECRESHRLFGVNVFIHKKEIEHMGTKIGDTLTFAIQLNAKGQPQAVGFREYSGLVKKKGQFTFIEHAELKKEYGKDVFVPPEEGKLLEDGNGVDFYVTLNEDGKPQAVGLRITSETPRPASIDGDTFSQQPTYYDGTVKSLGPMYGFIESDEVKQMYGRDVFVNQFAQHQTKLNVGDVVSFTMQLNAQGNPQVLDLKRRDRNDEDQLQSPKRIKMDPATA